jgi:probable phosphoglycerate mutase
VTRHGETEYSLNNIICGSTDCPLTDYGREQARKLAEDIRDSNLRIDVVYTSPLLRARETAEIISKAISVPCIVDDRLREQDCGAYEGNANRDDKEFNSARRHFANRLRGGDSALRLAQRVYNFLDEICVTEAERVPLIVGHACVCAMIHTYFNEVTNDEYFEYKLDNCVLAEYF